MYFQARYQNNLLKSWYATLHCRKNQKSTDLQENIVKKVRKECIFFGTLAQSMNHHFNLRWAAKPLWGWTRGSLLHLVLNSSCCRSNSYSDPRFFSIPTFFFFIRGWGGPLINQLTPQLQWTNREISLDIGFRIRKVGGERIDLYASKGWPSTWWYFPYQLQPVQSWACIEGNLEIHASGISGIFPLQILITVDNWWLYWVCSLLTTNKYSEKWH